MLDPNELHRLREAAEAESTGPRLVARRNLMVYLVNHAAEFEEALRDREGLEWVLKSHNINICRFESTHYGTKVTQYYNSRMHIDAAMKEGA